MTRFLLVGIVSWWCVCLQPELGQTSCNPCPLRFGAYPGSVICRECPSGTFRNSTAQPTCELCPAGTFSVQPLDGSGILDCIACEIGKYANNTGNGRCDVCPPGSFGTSGGQGLCTPCPIGKSNQFYGSLSCIECLSANVNGTIVCKECLEGLTYSMQCGGTMQFRFCMNVSPICFQVNLWTALIVDPAVPVVSTPISLVSAMNALVAHSKRTRMHQ